jgi:hypothetical protein
LIDPTKRAHACFELEFLEKCRDHAISPSHRLTELAESLKAVNEQLWEIEGALRDCESRGDFGEEFIRLARSVYLTNDQRAELKRQINGLLDSRLVEVKSYGTQC